MTLQEIEAGLRREPELNKLSPTVVEALARAVMRFVQARRLKLTLMETLMTKTLTALIAAVTSAIATAAVPTAADARCPGCVGEPPPYAPPGYLYYSSYHEPLPAPCNWYRVPVYDAYGNMVGWSGRPQAFCSWVGGFRPTP